MAEIGFKSRFLSIIPSAPATIPNNTVFIDSSNGNQASFKDQSGNVTVIGAVSASNIFIKEMQAEVAMSVNTPIAKKSNGKIVPADTDESDETQRYVGITLTAAVNPDDLVQVLLVGANIANAVDGLGFTVGREVYLDEGGGFTDDVTVFTGDDDSIIRVGIADCAAGLASSIAKDLIAFTEIVARP
jgi:hypothetical protein